MSSSRYDTTHIFSELDDPERQALVIYFLRHDPNDGGVSRFSFWKLWFSEIPRLKGLLAEGRTELNRNRYYRCMPHSYIGITGGPIEIDQELLKLNKVPTVNEQATATRDRGQCVLTKLPHNSSHPAYIFPPHMHQAEESRIEYYKDWLGMESEYGAERVERWRNAILTTGEGEGIQRIYNTDRPENMITLLKEVQQYWEDDLCVFRPMSLSEDKTSMDLAFHWLPLPGDRHQQLDVINLNDHPYPRQRMGCHNTPGNEIGIYNTATNTPILSGHIITLHTEDPKSVFKTRIPKGCCRLHRGKIWNGIRQSWVYNDRDADELEIEKIGENEEGEQDEEDRDYDDEY
ncbi:hypothetical protein N7493_007161 [Penicillium malachiteum]|uniref:HNH nuclease domain-containing protein n=1 Tax=Penicillium malachiteum TaxID=1324776 RepID=A0AAD6HIV1_9EURO|nr:hypothetical protein N7493_007161 [Penicillium malachiteum]